MTAADLAIWSVAIVAAGVAVLVGIVAVMTVGALIMAAFTWLLEKAGL